MIVKTMDILKQGLRLGWLRYNPVSAAQTSIAPLVQPPLIASSSLTRPILLSTNMHCLNFSLIMMLGMLRELEELEMRAFIKDKLV